MIKFVMCLTRHPGMTRDEFKDYWMNKHGPFFISNADEMGAKRYPLAKPGLSLSGRFLSSPTMVAISERSIRYGKYPIGAGRYSK